MSNEDRIEDKRSHPRVAISKRVVCRSDLLSVDGLLTDISASGAAIETETEFDEDFSIDLDIDDLGSYSGQVTRSFDDGFAVCFDIDEDEQNGLIMEIEKIHDAIGDENY